MSRYRITKKKLKNKTKSKKQSRSKYISRRKYISRNRKQKGGNNESLDIVYPDNIQINSQELTKEQTSSQPSITITNADPNKTYLLAMLDPDAPNGEGQLGNHTYTHWVITYKGSIPLNTYVKYAGPSPPRGKHNYIFNLYDVSNMANNMANNLDELKNNNDTIDRSNYYETTLENKIKIQNLQSISRKQFTVTA